MLGFGSWIWLSADPSRKRVNIHEAEPLFPLCGPGYLCTVLVTTNVGRNCAGQPDESFPVSARRSMKIQQRRARTSGLRACSM